MGGSQSTNSNKQQISEMDKRLKQDFQSHQTKRHLFSAISSTIQHTLVDELNSMPLKNIIFKGKDVGVYEIKNKDLFFKQLANNISINHASISPIINKIINLKLKPFLTNQNEMKRERKQLVSIGSLAKVQIDYFIQLTSLEQQPPIFLLGWCMVISQFPKEFKKNEWKQVAQDLFERIVNSKVFNQNYNI